MNPFRLPTKCVGGQNLCFFVVLYQNSGLIEPWANNDEVTKVSDSKDSVILEGLRNSCTCPYMFSTLLIVGDKKY